MKEHAIDGWDCWCSPRYLKPCDCDGAGCWQCVDGKIEVGRIEAEVSGDPIVAVHNEVEP